MLDVPRRLDQPALEVVQRLGRDPGVVLGKRLDPLRMDLGREQLGQRRGDGLDPRLRPAERHVRLADEPHAPAARAARPPSPPAARRAPSPSRIHISMPPVPGLRAVVIDDPLDPVAPDLGIGAVGEDRRVLPRHRALVGQPVGHPSLQLPARELSLVHQLMERMLRRSRSVLNARSAASSSSGASGASSVGDRRRRRRGQLGGVQECVMVGLASEGKPHAVDADREARPLDLGPLGRVLEQHGVGVVDVGVDPLPRTAAGPGARGCRPARRSAGGPSPARCARRCRAAISSSSVQKVPSKSTSVGPARRLEQRRHRARRSPGRRRRLRRWRRPEAAARPYARSAPRAAKRGGPAGTGKASHGQSRWDSRRGSRAERARRGRASVTVHLGEGPGDREDAGSRASRIACDRLAWRRPEGTGPRAAARCRACGRARRR